MTDNFKPGDLVVDREQPIDERGTAIVIRVADETAEDYYIDSLDATVAALNDSYPPDDPVVEVLFEGHLDRQVSQWRALLRDANEDYTFAEMLDDYRDEWNVPSAEYAYPASRLTARPYCPACQMRANHAGDGAWVCPNTDTGHMTILGGKKLNANEEWPRESDDWDHTTVNERTFRPDGGTPPSIDTPDTDGPGPRGAP